MATRVGRIAGLAGRAYRATVSPFGLMTIGSTAATLVYTFQQYADEKDWFNYSFKTTKDPDAIVDFYSTEDFLQILGIFPISIHMILAGVEWDNKSENTMDVWNTMRISFDITEKEEKIDGKDVVTMFNKRERFVQYIPFTRYLLWDQVQNYGYKMLPDGTIQVIHNGESFYGPWPVRLAAKLHAEYVVWATEKHINSPIFGTQDLEAQEHQRSNIPLHVVNNFLADLTNKQEAVVAKAKATGGSSAEQEQTLKKLKRLRRQQTTMYVDNKSGHEILSGNVRVRAEDPSAQKAIESAMRDIHRTEGSASAESTLSNLLNSPGVKDAADASAPAKKKALNA